MERCWPPLRVSKRRRNETKRAHMSTTHSIHQHCCRVENCLVAPFRQRSGLKSKIGRSANMRATGRGDSFHPVSTSRRRCLVQDHENAGTDIHRQNQVFALQTGAKTILFCLWSQRRPQLLTSRPDQDDRRSAPRKRAVPPCHAQLCPTPPRRQAST